MGRHGLIAMLIALLMSVAGCSGGDGDGTTTTAAATTTSGAPGGESTTTTGDESSGGTAVTTAATDANATAGSTTTAAVPEVGVVPEYSIQARISGESGDTVVVAVEPATYSDLDIETLVADVVQRFAPITTVHVIDDPAVVDLVLSEPTALTDEELASRDEHYFARLEEGFRLVFEGPFEDVGDVILGS